MPAHAYRGVLGLYAAVALPYLWTASHALAGLCGVDVNLAQANEVGHALTSATSTAAWVWLVLLLRAETGLSPSHRRARYAASSALLVLTVIDFAGLAAPSGQPTLVVGSLAQLTLLVWLAVAIAGHAGIPLGQVRPRARRKARTGSAPFWLVTGACMAAFLTAGALQNPLRRLPGPQGAEPPPEGLREHVELIVGIVWSSVIEEVAVTALVVALLAAARRPLWECLVVSALMRALPHMYLGWVTLAALALGVACAWLYYRYRRVLPLVVAHLGYDLILFAPPPYANAILVLAFLPSVLAVSVLQVRAEEQVTIPATRRGSPPSATAPSEKAGR
ncbi:MULTISPECIES: CPBP family intramembrane glutamic endopeptidase [unclassified Streptomyces]|uniref:CPBP family intramembrane glutamic endopeptidase n=1 Tax=unclassified Streptomyces TaxID=2593676 RepID=UPI002DDC1C79|nr:MULTISPECIES: CPBP family intramembrane glutamic endopeptidase [unclassified Streptomyces]WSA91646.1 CPBP family intramembrane metalloprotease [Streptomyces sp. NBC_01795]WSB76018.1 CPBP family intramembrane metalloprotease [Streptomyces sp. NBC_01775]WSS15708.1 CPBP family intramembrane metalloprotease [Streptomyces sp. NBC_01186]WSS44548.1 CPBP family intramembrane metalloprotease [Streptomyces sp. NBC_01187]